MSRLAKDWIRGQLELIPLYDPSIHTLEARWEAGEWRNNSLLIDCVEALGDGASGSFANLKVVEIPNGVDFEINDYDGYEWIAEKHRRWE